MSDLVKKGYDHISAKYVFSGDEKIEIAAELARKTSELDAIEDEKKSIASDYKAKIDALKGQTKVLSNNYTNGFEFRNTKCTLYHNFTTKERLWMDETGDIVKREPLRAEDYQTNALDE